MFSFFKKKPPAPAEPALAPEDVASPAAPPAADAPASGGAFGWLRKPFGAGATSVPEPAAPSAGAPAAIDAPLAVPEPAPKPEGARQGWMDRLKSGLRNSGGRSGVDRPIIAVSSTAS